MLCILSVGCSSDLALDPDSGGGARRDSSASDSATTLDSGSPTDAGRTMTEPSLILPPACLLAERGTNTMTFEGDPRPMAESALGDGRCEDPATEPVGASVHTCAVRWSECRPVDEPLTIAEEGQLPDLVWTGSNIVLVYQRLAEGDNRPEVVVIDANNRIVSQNPIDDVRVGGGGLRIAYNPDDETAVVLAEDLSGDEGEGASVIWLAADGTVREPVQPVGGGRMIGEIFAHGEGFRLMSGDPHLWASPRPNGLEIADLESEPAPIELVGIDARTSQATPVHAPGPRGFARWVTTSFSRDEASANMFPVCADGTLGLEHPLSGAVPVGRLYGAAELDGQPYVLFQDRRFTSDRPDSDHLYLTRLNATDDTFTRFRIQRCGGELSLLRLGNELVIFRTGPSGSSLSGESFLGLEGVVFDENQPGLARDPRVVSDEVTRTPRVTPTDNGFAIVWGEGWSRGSIRVQRFDCCIPE